MKKRLVLFDIDGTLLSAGGAGRYAITKALQEHYGPVDHAAHWSFGGKTDPQICHELLGHAGLTTAEVEALMPRVLRTYLDLLTEALPTSTSCHLKPGVMPLLDSLRATPGVCLGLLTGNLHEGAQVKLNRFSLGEYFALGAYGSDHKDRHELPAIAIRRAEALTGHVHRGKEVVIIGDTEHDIHCGRAHGVRAIAVGTGAFSIEELAPHGADHLFADLSDTERVLAAILD